MGAKAEEQAARDQIAHDIEWCADHGVPAAEWALAEAFRADMVDALYAAFWAGWP
jgi:hypothetical protein